MSDLPGAGAARPVMDFNIEAERNRIRAERKELELFRRTFVLSCARSV